jgi:hypothetical protein
MPSIAADVRTEHYTEGTRTDVFLLEQTDIGSCVVVPQPELAALFGSVNHVHGLIIFKGYSIHHQIKRNYYHYL